jgi:hypothetical protein
MPLDERAYLSDVVEACDAIQSAIRGLLGLITSRLRNPFPILTSVYR